MSKSLRGKIALVTGSASGIGLSVASRLAKDGATVIVNDIRAEGEIGGIRQIFDDRGLDISLYRQCDIADSGQLSEMIEGLRSEVGTIDILVNNAGLQHVSPLTEFPEEKWNAIINVNLTAAFLTMRACLADMKASGWGRVVNIASIQGLIASPFKSAYVASKHGVIGLTKSAALEFAESGVTINAICPAYVQTPLLERQIPEIAKSHGITEEQAKTEVILANQPTRRFIEPEEVASLAAFLCSDAAASITGSAITLDGGWTAQ